MKKRFGMKYLLALRIPGLRSRNTVKKYIEDGSLKAKVYGNLKKRHIFDEDDVMEFLHNRIN